MANVPAPGRLIDIGTHRLHVHCQGVGAPAVVFDAALGGSSLSWTLVQPAVAQVTRACVYDRAGFGWSEPGPLPRTAGRVADELRTLLRAEVPPPYVLVGHSFGGLVMRLLAARHPEDVAGLVLIEPAIPDEWVAPTPERRVLIARGTRLCRYGVAAARLGVARAVSSLVGAGAPGMARFFAMAFSHGRLRREDEGVLAPIWRLPPETRSVLRHMWTQPKFFAALGSQIATICESAAEVSALPANALAAVPLVVITAADAAEPRLRADAALARQSARGRHVLAPNSTHWVPLDAPDVVSREIVRLVEEIRTSR